MHLYLVRHGIAAERDEARWPDDAARPLTERGQKRFRKAARGLRTIAALPEVVLASPYTRAWDTALLLASVVGWPRPIECRELAGSSIADLRGALHAYAGAVSIALVGHEPLLSQLASGLLAPDAADFIVLKKGAVARIDLASPTSDGPATLAWLLQPRHLRALA